MSNQNINDMATTINGQMHTLVQMPLIETRQNSTNDHVTTIQTDETLFMNPTQINQAVKDAKEAFKTGKTKDIKFRKIQLNNMLKMMTENKDKICDALLADLNKPPFETMLCEYNLLINEIYELLHYIDEHDEPEHKSKTLLTFFDSVYVKHEPLGTVLVMGAWNYPLLLLLQPVAGAIAAGNCVVAKVSEHSPATGRILAELASQYLDKSCYKVINCDLQTSKYLLAEQTFDHIFYTGGDSGGKAVYQAASKNLTPVVLELGGKSPVYIDDDVCDKEAVWARLFWGKFLNAGQTCVAPDYVLCSEKAQQHARKHFQKALDQFYNGNACSSQFYPRIVNAHHFERIKRLLKESRLTVGGKLDKDKLTVEPAIALDVSLEDTIMQEEIFGPVLPFVTCASAQKAIDIINSRPKPLALYIFSNSTKTQKRILSQTSSGGVCINDTILHISAPSLPFGGVGGSGFGRYHGKYTLEAFSNKRSVLSRGYNPMLEWIGSNRYPPYNSNKLFILTQLGMNRKVWLPGPKLTNCLVFATGVASVFAYQALSMII